MRNNVVQLNGHIIHLSDLVNQIEELIEDVSTKNTLPIVSLLGMLDTLKKPDGLVKDKKDVLSILSFDIKDRVVQHCKKHEVHYYSIIGIFELIKINIATSMLNQ